MDSISYIKEYLGKSIYTKQTILDDVELLNNISIVANLIVNAYKNGNKVILAGNGGSAADAQHIAAEFVSRFFYDRPGLPALSLSTDTSMLTAIGNDYGYEKLFSRQLAAQAKPGDIFIGISTSGNSANIINAMELCDDLKITGISLAGNKGVLSNISHYDISVPSGITPFIQESHITIGHMICAIVEESIFPRDQYGV